MVPETRWLKHADHLRFFQQETTEHYEEHRADLEAVLAAARRVTLRELLGDRRPRTWTVSAPTRSPDGGVTWSRGRDGLRVARRGRRLGRVPPRSGHRGCGGPHARYRAVAARPGLGALPAGRARRTRRRPGHAWFTSAYRRIPRG